MLQSEPHDSERLTRLVLGDLVGGERAELERHLAQCASCREFVSFVREFSDAMREAKPALPYADEPCPDASLIVALEDETLDEERGQHVRAHMVFCESCREAYYALRQLRPRVVDVGLRVAGGALFEVLRPPEGGEWQLLPATIAVTRGTQALAAPFRVAETLTDPDNRSNKSKVALRVEEGIEKDRVRVVVECDPVPRPWKWKVCFFDGNGEELARIPLTEPQIEVARGISYGFYSLDVRKDEELLGIFKFTVEPFNVPEAIKRAHEYQERRDYRRAFAILQDAHEREPGNDDVLQELSLTRALAAEDEKGLKREEEKYAQVRGASDFLEETWEVLDKAKARFGERLAYVLGARRRDPAVLSDERAARLREEKLSFPVLQTLELLRERMKTDDERLSRLLKNLTSRIGDFSALMQSVQQSIDDIRGEADKDADEKFSAVAQLLERTGAAIEQKGVSLPGYGSLFRTKLGDACWQWTERDAQKIFTSAEGLYWYLGSQPAVESPDFSPALLQVCRGFELLINERIGKSCSAIWSTVRPRRDLLGLMKAQHPSFEPDKAFNLRESISIWQFAAILRIGRVVEEAKPGTFGKFGALLTNSPGLADVELLVPLAYVGTVFRNGKIHPRPGSRQIFTTAEEMQLLRKLIFGLDESNEIGRDVFSYAERALWFSRAEGRDARLKLSAAWRKYPGLVKLLWEVPEIPPDA